MASRSRAPERKRQRTVDDSSEDDETSDAVNAAIEEEEDEDANENENDVNDEDLQDLEEEEEEDEEEDEEEEDDDDEEVEEDEPVADVDDDDDDDDGVDAEDDDASLDDESEQPEDDEDMGLDAAPSRRMTARQRNRQLGTTANIGVVDIDELGGSNRSKKKALSAEEQRVKRAEMARRRRNLSQKRLEEEKQDTLDKLLKKRAGKVRGETDEHGEPVNRTLRSRLQPQHPAFLSWRSAKDGFTLSMTEERAKQEGLA